MRGDDVPVAWVLNRPMRSAAGRFVWLNSTVSTDTPATPIATAPTRATATAATATATAPTTATATALPVV